MLYIILLLVVVLIIALVLKKRSAAQPETKSALKGTAKKGSAAKTATKTKLVEEPIITKQETTPLDTGLRSKIENLIQEKNYSAAEAQINQALNRNNSQHELYLLLLDIHVLQKDDFATSQLLTHLRSLNLDDIVAQAELREAQLKSSFIEKTEQQNHEFTSSQTASEQKDNTASHAADFSKINTTAFDQLQSETPITAQPVVETQPLEFEFKSVKKEELPQVEDKIEIEPERNLDFVNISVEPTSPTPQPVAIKNLTEFSFEPNTKVEDFKNEIQNNDTVTAEKTADAAIELNFDTFNFETEKVEEKILEPEQEIKTLDLDFTSIKETTSEPVVETVEPVTEQPKESLDFSFSQADANLAPSEPEVVIETSPTNSLDFNFSTTDTPIVEEKPAVETSFNTEPNLDFNLLGESTTAPIAAAAPAPVVESIDENDPLVQAFPELAEQSEAELNLVLASQYIQLGAFEAARELLDETQDQFNASQQQRAEELRNQLA